MRKSIQFWLVLANNLCTLVTFSSVQAQQAPNPVRQEINFQEINLNNIYQILRNNRSAAAVRSSVRTRKSISAWVEFSERWMYVDISTLLTPLCSRSLGQNESKFIVTGRGGLPPSPDEMLTSDAIQINWVTLNSGEEDKSSPAISKNSTAPHSDPIVEAQGWVIDNNGEIVLTAAAPSIKSNSSWLTPANCKL